MASNPFADHARRDFMRRGRLAVFAMAAQPHVVMAQTAGAPLKIMVGSGREGSALGKLFIKAAIP
jgi:hypothetical protein